MENKDSDYNENDREICQTIDTLISESETYRDEFSPKWEEITHQLNQNHPSDWSKKEDWQTKVFIPEQFKISEASTAMFKEMLFGNDVFFGVIGVEKTDREKEDYLVETLTALFRFGNFNINNSFVLQEAVDLGTSTLKILPDKVKGGLKFVYRPITKCGFDPNAYIDFEKSRFYWEEYDEDINNIKDNELYDKKAVDKLIEEMNGGQLITKNETDRRIQNASVSETSKKASKYQTVTLKEFWGLLPMEKEVEIDGKKQTMKEWEWRVVTKCNHIILRNKPNPLGFLPTVLCRVRRRRNDMYGYGMLYNTVDMQNLLNSFVNLGFDSAKLASIPIVKKNSSVLGDSNSIVLKPNAVWEMGDDMDAARIEVFKSVDTMDNIIRNLGYLDQLFQDASGVPRYAQGSQSNFGGAEETLGQSQMKMQATEKRFLKIAREISEDYVIPLLKKTVAIITHPDFVEHFQEFVNRVLGMKQVPNPQFKQVAMMGIDPNTQGIPQVVEVPKLLLSELGSLDLDFTPVSLINYMQRQAISQKLDKFISMSARNPQVNMILKTDKLYERAMQYSEIPDYQDLMRSEEERMAIAQQIAFSEQLQQMPQQGGQEQGMM